MTATTPPYCTACGGHGEISGRGFRGELISYRCPECAGTGWRPGREPNGRRNGGHRGT